MKIAILGYDTEGRSSYDYFAALGHQLEIRDQNSELVVPEDAKSVLGASYLDNLDDFDLLVRTPGLLPEKILAKNPGVADKITSQVNEFLRVSPTHHIIGVTGTKGKGTTATLLAKMLEAAGMQVSLGGNIGIPCLSFLPELTAKSRVVLELSSFQLTDCKYSPHIAVCLMVTPEHLNWHADLEDYMAAKSRLFEHQKSDDKAIYYAKSQTSKQIASSGQGQKIPYCAAGGAEIIDGAITIDGQIICRTEELKLLGRHNWQNACAAVTAAWQCIQDVAAIRLVLTSFTGLPHRLEPVGEFDDVRYYNDSFGTTPETAIVAIQAFENPKVLILGGSDKGADYAQLARVIADSNVRSVLLIGEQARRLQTALQAVGFTGFQPGGNTMTEIVSNARQAARPGDTVVLSPACASFDMFENYKDRGQQFTAAVQALGATVPR